MPETRRPIGAPAVSVHRARTDRLGVALTAVLASAFFGFIGCGAFAPALMARPLRPGGVVTVAFAFGLAVIALGVLLTAGYAAYANRDAE